MEKEVYTQIFNVEQNHWWFVARRKIITTLIDSLNLTRNASILEAGCGTGGNLAMLTQFGKVNAFDCSSEAMRFANSRIKANVNLAKGYLPNNIPFGSQKYDLICALDVIEHVEQDQQTLDQLTKRLKINGRLLLTVPSYMFLWSEHDQRHHHKRRYTYQSLIKLTKTAQLEIEYMSYYNFFLFLPACFWRLSKKILPIKKQDEQIPNKITNFLLRKIFSSDNCLLKKKIPLPFGLSLINIVKKIDLK